VTSTCTVLVVDDNFDAATTLAAVVEALGHRVRFVLHASETLDAARTMKPDIVFLDIGMPEIDGYMVANQLRTEFGHNLSIVALSGWGDPESRSKSAKAGFDAHLVKPADMALIKATIAQVCGPAPKRMS
jgi:CheY-like chemotaxis protein